MLEAAPRLDPARFTIFHQTGEDDRERVARAYAEAGITAQVVAYEPELPARYAWADLALCRAGALSVAELAIAGLPALLVPYPWAADDHQTANARELVAAGAARLLDPRSFGADAATRALDELAAQPGRLRAMAEAAAKLGRPDAAERIVEECRRMLGEAG
jgi:UDP-N-acetylglucosamine--N-acetylmuramyl-(pentapeptide) pyrophosphoryl-undecaprenol N-acetylglucosamine transferase